MTVNSSFGVNQDAELTRLIKENNMFSENRMYEENETNRRSLWVGIYREVFSDKRVHTLARDAADSAVSAYDEKFTGTK